MKYLNAFFIVFFIICSAETCSKKEPLPPIIPIADFSFELGKNGEVRFKNTSINAVKYIWDFGDGKTSVDESPTHFYEDEKEFTVKLNVNSKDNQSNSISKKINVDSYEPIPEFKVEHLEKGTVKITNQSQFASTYTWTIEGMNQKVNLNEFEYTFKKNGKHSIILTAEKTNGLSKKITKDIIIDNIPSFPASASFYNKFDGTILGEEIKWVETDTTIKSKMAFEYLCTSYFHSFKKNDLNLSFIIGLQGKNNGYSDLTKLFKINYNNTSTHQGVGYYCLQNSGLELTIFKNDGYYLEKPSVIAIQNIQKLESDCICNNEVYYVSYLIQGKNIKGTLSLKYSDPCCKSIEIK